MKRSFPFPYLVSALLLLSLLLLSGCGKKTPTPDPKAVYTSAAETVAAQLQTRGVPGAAATATLFTFNTPTPEIVEPPNGNATLPPVVQPTAALATNTPSVPDRAVWVAQSPADSSSIPVNTPFQMTWTVQNTGTTTWKTSYQLRYFVAGDKLGALLPVNLPDAVAPMRRLTINLNLTAPEDPGDYHGIWVLSTAEGTNFYPLDVIIKVVAQPTSTPTETATTAPTTVPPTPGPETFTDTPAAGS